VLIGAASFAACVLPDGLEIIQEPISMNLPPRIISQDPDPILNRTLTLPFESDESARTIRISVTDPNPRDTIFLRMFVDYDAGNTFIPRQAVSQPPDDPSLPRTTIEFLRLTCTDLGIRPDVSGGDTGAGGMAMPVPIRHVLEVVITDRNFDDQPQDRTKPINRAIAEGAFSDSRFWVFECE
jgi:hypothetical protein